MHSRTPARPCGRIAGTMCLVLLQACSSDAATPQQRESPEVHGGVVAESRLDSLAWMESERVATFDGVARTASGFLVLDLMGKELHSFDSEYEHAAVIARQGRGPEELAMPMGMALLGDTLALVLDPVNLKLLAIDLTTVAPSVKGSYPLTFEAPRQICIVDSRIIVQGLYQGAMLHEIRLDGEIIRSFGRSASSSVTEQLYGQIGILLCNRDVLVYVTQPFGTVKVFDWEGHVVLTDTLENFDATLSEERGGRVTLSPGEVGYAEWVTGAAIAHDSLLIVSTDKRVPGRAFDPRLRAFRLSDLTEVDDRWALPLGRLLAGSQHDTIWVVSDELQPRVTAYEINE